MARQELSVLQPILNVRFNDEVTQWLVLKSYLFSVGMYIVRIVSIPIPIPILLIGTDTYRYSYRYYNMSFCAKKIKTLQDGKRFSLLFITTRL